MTNRVADAIDGLRDQAVEPQVRIDWMPDAFKDEDTWRSYAPTERAATNAGAREEIRLQEENARRIEGEAPRLEKMTAAASTAWLKKFRRELADYRFAFPARYAEFWNAHFADWYWEPADREPGKRKRTLRWPYAPVPRAILRADLSAYAKLAGAVLADVLNVNRYRNHSFEVAISDRELAKRMKVDPRAARKATDELAAARLITKTVGTGHAKSRYRFTPKCAEPEF